MFLYGGVIIDHGLILNKGTLRAKLLQVLLLLSWSYDTAALITIIIFFIIFVLIRILKYLVLFDRWLAWSNHLNVPMLLREIDELVWSLYRCEYVVRLLGCTLQWCLHLGDFIIYSRQQEYILIICMMVHGIDLHCSEYLLLRLGFLYFYKTRVTTLQRPWILYLNSPDISILIYSIVFLPEFVVIHVVTLIRLNFRVVSFCVASLLHCFAILLTQGEELGVLIWLLKSLNLLW